jgi:ribose transport system substrate-binding protein
MRYRSVYAALILAAAALAGCVQDTPQAGGNTPAPPPGGGKKGPNDRLKIAVVPKGTTHEFWQTIKAGADAAGQELNVEILWNGPKRETDIQDQIDIIKNYATQGVDGVALAATDKTALVETVKELQAKGITVVVIDSGIDEDIASSFVATDNVAAAEQGAKEMGKLLGGKGKVAVLSFLKGAATSDEREEGFLKGIAEFPGIEIVAKDDTQSDSAKAQDKMETILTQHPDLAGVFASNEPNVIGVSSALKGRNLVGKVKVVGFDAAEAEIKAMQDGEVHALIVQDPFKMGYEGVKAIAQLVRGQGTPEKRIDTGAKIVTPQNMNTPEMEKILYPLGKK